MGDRVFRSTGMSGTGNGDPLFAYKCCEDCVCHCTVSGYEDVVAGSCHGNYWTWWGACEECRGSMEEDWRGRRRYHWYRFDAQVVDVNGVTKSATSHVVDDYNCGTLSDSR